MEKDRPIMGRIISNEIVKNRDGDRPVRMLTVEISDPEDIQSVEQYTLPGIDSNPPKDSLCEIIPNGEAWKVATAINDKIDKSSDLKEGEIEIYSSSPGSSRYEKQATSRYERNKDILHDAKDIHSNADEGIFNYAGINIRNESFVDTNDIVGNDNNVEIGNNLDMTVGNDAVIEIEDNLNLKILNEASVIIDEITNILVGNTLEIKSTATLKLIGVIVEINEGLQSGVSFPALKVGFDAFVIWANAHTHSAGGSGPPVAPFAGTIDASESSTVKVP